MNDTLLLEVKLSNVNDHDPVIGNDDGTQDVAENSPRGTSLGDYGATDMDNTNSPGFDAISYSLSRNACEVLPDFRRGRADDAGIAGL